jgi:hypothetical protein
MARWLASRGAVELVGEGVDVAEGELEEVSRCAALLPTTPPTTAATTTTNAIAAPTTQNILLLSPQILRVEANCNRPAFSVEDGARSSFTEGCTAYFSLEFSWCSAVVGDAT